MPLYEYECTACKRHTEKIQKFSDPEITACPHCGGALKRVLSAPAFSMKGGGWYADGYGSVKPPAPASEGGTPPPASGDSGAPAGAPAASPTAAAPAPASAPAAAAVSSEKK